MPKHPKEVIAKPGKVQLDLELPAGIREFSSNLASWGRKLNLSQYDLADAFVVDQGTISRWLNGQSKPTLENVLTGERNLGIPHGALTRPAANGAGSLEALPETAHAPSLGKSKKLTKSVNAPRRRNPSN